MYLNNVVNGWTVSQVILVTKCSDLRCLLPSLLIFHITSEVILSWLRDILRLFQLQYWGWSGHLYSAGTLPHSSPLSPSSPMPRLVSSAKLNEMPLNKIVWNSTVPSKKCGLLTKDNPQCSVREQPDYGNICFYIRPAETFSRQGKLADVPEKPKGPWLDVHLPQTAWTPEKKWLKPQCVKFHRWLLS